MDRRLISKCGIYCGACYIYRAFRDRGKMPSATVEKLGVPEEEIKCYGCSGPAEDLWRNCRKCPIVACLKGKKPSFCYECPQFESSSCAKYEELREFCSKRGENAREALLRIKAGDAENWLKEEDRKWRCTACGSRTWWEQETCYKCGQPIGRR